MEEKLKKAIKTSKQGIGIVLTLYIFANAISAIAVESIWTYLQNYYMGLIFIAALITGLVLYKKEKYCQGAEIVQWAALANIIMQFVNTILAYVITKEFAINIISIIIGSIIPIILIVESLKVIRLTEGEKRSNKITIIAIVIIALMIIAQIIITNNVMKQLDEAMTQLKGEIQDGIDNAKEELEQISEVFKKQIQF